MKTFKLVIAGGGSTYTPGIVKSLLNQKDKFKLKELVLYDINAERQEAVGVIVRHVVEMFDPELKLTLTTDPETAMTDADFIFAQMRVGLYAMREKDEKIPLQYGVVGQETCGPGGLAYGLRTIYPMVELIDYCEKWAKPTYWIVNYSNPAAIVATATFQLRPHPEHLRYAGGHRAQYGRDPGLRPPRPGGGLLWPEPLRLVHQGAPQRQRRD